MDRRRFLVSTAGATTAVIGMPELAFANFGVPAELLLEDLLAEPFPPTVRPRGRTALEASLG